MLNIIHRHSPAVAIKFSFITAPPHRCVLENPKNDVRLTDTCHGYCAQPAFLPPTILTSGRADAAVEIPQSKFLAAEIVSRPGMGVIGGSSADIVFSKISVELIDEGLKVVAVVVIADDDDNVVAVVGRRLIAVVCMTVVSCDGFTGFA